MDGKSYWHAHAEKNGRRLAGSDLDAIEAATADSAARRATRHFWIERRELFDHSNPAVREIVVVVARHLAVDASSDTTTPTLGPPSRWRSRVVVTQEPPGLFQSAEDAFDRTQMASIEVEVLSEDVAR
jgi:hypothetical protein